MIRKLLIANRGEIACRIMRTCAKVGISTVAVFSDADRHALHVQMANEAIHIGASPAPQSYLNIDRIIDAAKKTKADAIHPGYGFLAENAAFAQAVQDAGITFIGPNPETIAAMGSKQEAKRLLKDIPLLPGYADDDQSDNALIEAAHQIDYPVMVKAAAGGGGRGMRRVDSKDSLVDALATARREAKQAFDDDTLILEKCLERPRHVEIQIFGDIHGNIVTLGERECSIQRRHQKIIEESPSPALNDKMRQQLCEVAWSVGQQLNYINAGTIEFLLDQDNNFYFMEMNTRLQVEHPVTELVYGVDLVEWQIRVAEGELLSDISGSNEQFLYPANPIHAIEARINTERASADFAPTTGTILSMSSGDDTGAIRLDAGVQTGDIISPYYDSMQAKLIASGRNRQQAIQTLDYALGKLQILGVETNINFLRQIITHPDFLAGNLSTHFIDDHPELFENDDSSPVNALITAAVMKYHRASKGGVGWRNNPHNSRHECFILNGIEHKVALSVGKSQPYKITLNDTSYTVEIALDDKYTVTIDIDRHQHKATVVSDQEEWWVHIGGQAYHLKWVNPIPIAAPQSVTKNALKAPMPGQVMSILVESGEQVEKGVILMTLEAMKMEHRIKAPSAGIVGKIHYSVGDTVQADTVLLELNPNIS